MSATDYVKKQLEQKKKANPKAYTDPAKKKPLYKESKGCKKK